MNVFRIVHKSYSELVSTGKEGRWNTEGKKVIYASENLATAFLESMLRRQGVGFNTNFLTLTLSIPHLKFITTIKENKLPSGWKSPNDYVISQKIGDAWYLSQRSVVLKIPSAILADSYNIVINTTHKDFKFIKLIDTSVLIPDYRIEEILKNNHV
jgi:RES domain-containing protein